MIAWVCPIRCIAAALALSTWGSTSGQDKETAFAVSHSSAESAALKAKMAATLIQVGAEKCVLWSMSPELPSYEPEGLTKCSGSQPLPQGRSVRWTSETKDGRSFARLTIDSKEYDLAKGRLFLLSGKAGALKVLQLAPNPSKLTIGSLEDLAKEDRKIRDFFRK
jgi:hypothetical protein